MSSLPIQQIAASLFYAALGRPASLSDIEYYASRVELNIFTYPQITNTFLTSTEGQEKYSGQSNSTILQTIFTRVYGRAATNDEINTLLSSGSLNQAVTNATLALIQYKGFDNMMLTEYNAFKTTINKILYPGIPTASAGQGGANALALYYVLGSTSDPDSVTYWGGVLNKGTQTFTQVAQIFINARSYITSLNNTDYVTRLFHFGLKRTPTSDELSHYLNELNSGTSRGAVLVEVISAIRSDNLPSDAVAKQSFLTGTTTYQPGYLPDLPYQEAIAAAYLAIPLRDIDASGLQTWSLYLANTPNTLAGAIAQMLTTKEFKEKGGSLVGDAFIQHVYNAIYGVPASSALVAHYSSAYGSSNATLAAGVITDFINSQTHNNHLSNQVYNFAAKVATSLLYETFATLTVTQGGGFATGTINSGTSHTLSLAETAALTDVILNTDFSSLVDFRPASTLANLTINGTQTATVRLSDSNINPGVNVVINNNNVILFASSGNDTVQITSSTDLTTGTASLELGRGNDTLLWAGNATSNTSPNNVSYYVQADGGLGVDIISANFFTKTFTVNQNAAGVRTTTISSNAGNFSSFEQIDLTGYSGKSTGQLIVTDGSGNQTTSAITTASNTFDYGLLTAAATIEGTTTNSIIQSELPDKMGGQGFIVHGLTTANVLNVTGGDAANLLVNGDATAASALTFNLVDNVTEFNINFDAISSSTVHAGTIKIIGNQLDTLYVNSNGTGQFNNDMTIVGAGTLIHNMVVGGTHFVNIHFASSLSSLQKIDAKNNSAGVNITTDYAGNDDGLFTHLLSQLSSKDPAKSAFTLNIAKNLLKPDSQQVIIEGSSGEDTFNVLSNTTVTGGAGANTYILQSSKAQSGNTITDFDHKKDTILDKLSGLKLSDSATGYDITDYGVQRVENINLDKFINTQNNDAVEILGHILAANNTNTLTNKVGLSSILQQNGTINNYVIIDNNDNHLLDGDDTVIHLIGQDHNNLVKELHYGW